ncbi:carbohydrate kinase [Hydrogenophaga taeniospiralis CCUG 15921]|uniref:Gluconokinase n=1 Tax=Hydrogenophaga taeniospiralis CCUG 15921 TaxID=1281780 RepID=A0A9X4SCU0_9BURK|nr:gluconokinase [Hydrogenophaga taeniospiralis]MDG5977088.1 carbohydrate kinase [Hydrogenophaga taeniospiralis CCUG 15921]
MGSSIVIMGVSGCGKSSLGAAVARAEVLPLIEGDDHHSEQSRSKMSQGIALTDEDRDGWLTLLGEQLGASPNGAVLTCSALKHKYREHLRAASPGLRFVFLDLTREEAQARVSSRSAHFFSASLVDSQFAALESPVGEPGVLRVDATAPLGELQSQVSDWLKTVALPQS